MGAESLEGNSAVKADALTFVTAPHAYDRCLIKEMIHHIDVPALPQFFSGLHRQLSPGGRVVIMTRPRDPDYPFFPACMEAWKDTQEHHGFYTERMEAAGFRVEVETAVFQLTVAKERWMRALRNRFGAASPKNTTPPSNSRRASDGSTKS